jgi:hypothetical protein
MCVGGWVRGGVSVCVRDGGCGVKWVLACEFSEFVSTGDP